MKIKNFEEKKRFMKSVQQTLLIRQNYGSIAADCHNLIGGDMSQISNLYNQLQFASSHEKQHFQDKIKKQENLLVHNFIKNMKSMLYLFDRQNIYAVFDGKKSRIPGKARGFDWMEESEDKNSTKTMDFENTSSNKHTPEFWQSYDNILHTLKFLAHRMGIRVVQALFEADHQIIKMFDQKIIQCVFSRDHDYVDYGVPLIKSFYENGKGLVIDFEKANLNQIINSRARKWVKETKDIKKNNSLMKRILLGILCGEKHIESFKALHVNTLIDELISWSPEIETFSIHLKRKYPRIYIPEEYLSRFSIVNNYSYFAIVKSLLKQKCEPLFNDFYEVLMKENHEEIHSQRQIVGEEYQYSIYSPETYADVVPVIGGKTREEIGKMRNQEFDKWLLNGERQWSKKLQKQWVMSRQYISHFSLNR